MTRRTAYSARWVLPVSRPPIAQGAVVVEEDRIVEVGSAASISAHDTVELGDMALVPGLVNVHAHLELTVLRGYLEALDFDAWLRTLTDVRANVLDADALYHSALAGVYEGLAAGVTTFADATASGYSLAAMRDAGVRGRVYLETFGPDAAQCKTSFDALRAALDVLRPLASERVQLGVSPHAPYTVSPDLFARVARYANDEHLPVSVHVAESRAELDYVTNGDGAFAHRLRARGIAVAPLARSPVALLEQTGLLDCAPLLVHAIHVDDEDIEMIAAKGATIAHCPTSNAKLGHGAAPLHDWLARGIRTGLGSDSVASNNRMDILQEARMAALLHAMSTGKADSLSAHDALRLATSGGAAALGMEQIIGTLDEGKRADFVAFPLDNMQPVFDPAVTLVHALAGAVRPKLVMVDGAVRVRDGEVVDRDTSLAARVQSIGERLRAARE